MKPNVIKFHQEITQLIQHMILSPDYLQQLKNNQLKNHIHRLLKIQKLYFGQEALPKVLSKYQSHKNLQILVNLCFQILRYVLY